MFNSPALSRGLAVVLAGLLATAACSGTDDAAWSPESVELGPTGAVDLPLRWIAPVLITADTAG